MTSADTEERPTGRRSSIVCSTKSSRAKAKVRVREEAVSGEAAASQTWGDGQEVGELVLALLLELLPTPRKLAGERNVDDIV